MGLRVITIRKAEDPVQQGPMPATEQFQHACLIPSFPNYGFLETIITERSRFVKIVSRKLWIALLDLPFAILVDRIQ